MIDQKFKTIGYSEPNLKLRPEHVEVISFSIGALEDEDNFSVEKPVAVSMKNIGVVKVTTSERRGDYFVMERSQMARDAYENCISGRELN